LKKLASEFTLNQEKIPAGFPRSSQPIIRSTRGKFLRTSKGILFLLLAHIRASQNRDSAFVRSSRLIRDILAKMGSRLASSPAFHLPFSLFFFRLTVPKLSSRGRIIRKLVRLKILEEVARDISEREKFSPIKSKS